MINIDLLIGKFIVKFQIQNILWCLPWSHGMLHLETGWNLGELRLEPDYLMYMSKLLICVILVGYGLLSSMYNWLGVTQQIVY